MIKQSELKTILTKAVQDGVKITEADIAFVALRNILPEDVAFRVLHSPMESTTLADYKVSAKIKYLEKELVPYGLGVEEFDDISDAENKADLIKLLHKVQEAYEDGTLDTKDALKLETDIRVKLKDKFQDKLEEDSEKRIIIVPQKHDIICPHSHRECTYMPTKEACKKYYKLTE